MKTCTWAKEALERDGGKCVECGSEESLVVHLINQSAKRPKRKEVTTLCRNCHAEAHKQFLKFSRPTKELIEELRLQKKSFSFIASHLGITRTQVYNIRNRTKC